jgi:hypothetical protein
VSPRFLTARLSSVDPEHRREENGYMVAPSPPGPTPTPPAPLSAEEKAKVRVARLTVIAAVIGLVGTGLGVWGGYQKEQKDDAQQEVSELKGQVRRLADENRVLVERLENTTTTTAAPTTTRAPGTTATTVPAGRFFGEPIQKTTTAIGFDDRCPEFQGKESAHGVCLPSDNGVGGNRFDWRVSGDPSGRAITGTLGVVDECTSGQHRLTFLLDGNEALNLETTPLTPLNPFSIPVPPGQHLLQVQVFTLKRPALTPRSAMCPYIQEFRIA